MDDPDILIVDDDRDALSAAAMLVSDLGYRVKTAEQPHAALSLVSAMETLRILVTDVLMPGMNGFELADAAKRMRPELCVIYVTGYAKDLLPQATTLHGALLVKPWTLDQLEAEIKRCLS